MSYKYLSHLVFAFFFPRVSFACGHFQARKGLELAVNVKVAFSSASVRVFRGHREVRSVSFATRSIFSVKVWWWWWWWWWWWCKLDLLPPPSAAASLCCCLPLLLPPSFLPLLLPSSASSSLCFFLPPSAAPSPNPPQQNVSPDGLHEKSSHSAGWGHERRAGGKIPDVLANRLTVRLHAIRYHATVYAVPRLPSSVA